jgi:hypothetical protein
VLGVLMAVVALMGWGEPHRPSPQAAGEALAAAVRAFLSEPTTGNHQRLAEALATFDGWHR